MTTNLIRCAECKSIDPFLYTDRKICCELVYHLPLRRETWQRLLDDSRFRSDSVVAQLMRQCNLD